MARKPTWSWLKGLTPEESDFAMRRTEFLFDRVGSELSLRQLLANAYMQGLCDASEVMAIRDAKAGHEKTP